MTDVHHEAYRAARETAAWGWFPRDQFAMLGSDAASVLHKLCSNEIVALAEGRGCEAFVLTVQGKLAGHIFAYRSAEGLWIDTAPGQAEPLIALLDRYVIREKVEFKPLPDWQSLLVLGPAAERPLRELLPDLELPTEKPGQWLTSGPLAVRRLSWVTGWQLAGAHQALSALAEQLTSAGVPDGSGQIETIRIEQGFPTYGIDIGADNLPQEVQRDELAISFNKGCYLGQETVARIDAMGHVNRHLVGLTLAGAEPPPPGAELVAGEKSVGKVTSSCQSILRSAPLALAVVRREHAAPGSQLECDGRVATVVALPAEPS